MNRSFAVCLMLALFLSNVSLTWAQEPSPAPADGGPPVPTLPNVETSSPLNCFDYYRFGSVNADLQPTVGQSVPGATMTFTGKVVNENDYPLLDGTLYVKIFKRDENVFAGGDGNPVVDQFVVAEGITLPAKGELEKTYSWKIPMNAEGGEYYAAYFYTTSNRYNLMGLSFTDDVVGNQAPFTIKNESDVKLAKLSKINTTLNGEDHNFAAFPLHFAAGDTVKVETTINNPSDKSKTMPLQFNQYAWDAISKDNLRFTKTEVVTLEAGETKTVSYEIQPQRESVVYIVAVTQDIEVKSILNVRYVRDGIEETRINFPGLTAFPIAKDTDNTLFACAHSTNLPVVPGNILTLTLADKDGKVIHEYRYEGDIYGAMGGYGEMFKSATNVNYALLTATLERNGVIVEQVKTEYDCNVIDPATCLPGEGVNSFLDWIKDHLRAVILLVVILLLVVAIIVFITKRPRKEHINDMTTPTQ